MHVFRKQLQCSNWGKGQNGDTFLSAPLASVDPTSILPIFQRFSITLDPVDTMAQNMAPIIDTMAQNMVPIIDNRKVIQKMLGQRHNFKMPDVKALFNEYPLAINPNYEAIKEPLDTMLHA
jgi:hypothetical protein